MSRPPTSERILPRFPLRYRLGPRQQSFVGRHDELALLDALTHRSSVAWVWGAGGRGKSSLVREWLHRSSSSSSSSPSSSSSSASPSPSSSPSPPSSSSPRDVLWLGVFGHRGADHHEVELLKVLSGSEGDFRALSRDTDALHEALFELAEAGGVTIVIDDAHHHSPRIEDLVALIRTHARNCRVIVTSRARPERAELATCALQLPPLDAASMETLLRSAAPHLSDVERRALVGSSNGSPLRLLAGLGGTTIAERAPWEGLAASAASLAEVLALVDAPLSFGLCASVLGAPIDEALGALEGRGLVARGPGHVATHDVVRAEVSPALLDGARARWGKKLATALEATDDAMDALEAASLHLALGALTAARDLVDARFEAMVGAGLASDLYARLADVEDSALVALRMRAALVVGTGEALTWARSEPVPSEVRARLAWAHAAALAGAPDAALDVAEPLRHAPDVDTAFDAALLCALARRLLGELDRSLAETSSLHSNDATRIAQRAVERAQCFATRGDAKESLAELRAAESVVAEARAGARIDLWGALTATYFRLGLLREAARTSRRLRSDALVVPTSSGLELAVATVFSIESGDLSAGRSFLGRLRRCAADSALLRGIAGLADLRLAVAEGATSAAEEAAELLQQIVAEPGLEELRAWADGLTCYAEVALGVGETNVDATTSLEVDVSIATPLARLIARRRGRLTAATPSRPSSSLKVELFRLRELAESAMLRGEHESARASLARQRFLAEKHGWALHEVDGLALRADLAILESQPGHAIPRLIGLADRMRRSVKCDRTDRDAAFYGVFADLDHDATPLLQELAQGSASPTATRRARAILSGTLPTDELDALVVTALIGRREKRPATSSPVDLDEATHTVTLEDGAKVSLARRPLLFELLSALVRAPTTVSKERLVLAVWKKPAYHPLSDDNRLHVAIRRLRRALGDETDPPRLLRTTSDGYALIRSDPPISRSQTISGNRAAPHS